MASNVLENVEHVQEGELDEGTATIEVLPDECILSIFEHLWRKDILALTLVTKRFNSIVDRWFCSKFSETTILIYQFPSLRLQKFGSSIISLRLSFDANEEIMEEICEQCPNLKKLEVS